ncbi:MAG: hypothetical protein ACP5NF_07880 [Thermoanaerobaculum sp.]
MGNTKHEDGEKKIDVFDMAKGIASVMHDQFASILEPGREARAVGALMSAIGMAVGVFMSTVAKEGRGRQALEDALETISEAARLALGHFEKDENPPSQVTH